MLRIQFYADLLKPKQIEAKRAVVLDCFGNPLTIAIEDSPQTYIYSCRDNPDFDFLLKALGISRTVIETDAKQKPLSEVIWTP